MKKLALRPASAAARSGKSGNSKTKTKQPRTPKQREQSRINGAKSKGPITDHGKAVSAMNAYKHGLYSPCLSVPDGESHDFLLHLAGYLAEFQPISPSIRDLVVELAHTSAELQRLRVIQAGLWDEAWQSAVDDLVPDRFPENEGEIQPELVCAYTELMSGRTYPRLESRINRLRREFEQTRKLLQTDLAARQKAARGNPPPDLSSDFYLEQLKQHFSTPETDETNPAEPPVTPSNPHSSPPKVGNN